MRTSFMVILWSLWSVLFTGCSFDRDPGLGQNMTFDLQWFSDYNDISSAAYTAFRQNPCIVLRYCGDQVGCNETPPKKMDFDLSDNEGDISFGVNLALRRNYRFQLLGYSDTGNSCKSMGSQPIQLGISETILVALLSFPYRVTPNYQSSGSFEKINRP